MTTKPPIDPYNPAGREDAADARSKSFQKAMQEALKGLPDDLERALDIHEQDPDIGDVVKHETMNDYGMCMCAAATGSSPLFKRVCTLGGAVFEVDEASGDTPFSVALFNMNRKFPGVNEELFRYLLDIGVMLQPSTYFLDDLVGSIWQAGIQTGKSKDFVQAAIDGGLGVAMPAIVPDDEAHTVRPSPLENMVMRLDESNVECLEWLLESGNVLPDQIQKILDAVDDRNISRLDRIRNGVDSGVIDRLMGSLVRAMALQSHLHLDDATRSAETGSISRPRF